MVKNKRNYPQLLIEHNPEVNPENNTWTLTAVLSDYQSMVIRGISEEEMTTLERCIQVEKESYRRVRGLFDASISGKLKGEQ